MCVYVVCSEYVTVCPVKAPVCVVCSTEAQMCVVQKGECWWCGCAGAMYCYVCKSMWLVICVITA